MAAEKFTIEAMDNGYVVRVDQFGASKNVVFKDGEFVELLALLIETYKPAEGFIVARRSDDAVAPWKNTTTDDEKPL